MKKRQVIIRRCDEYDPARIAKIIDEGVRELGLEPKGRVLIKPNVVTANTEYIHHSYTEPRMVESMVSVLRSRTAAIRSPSESPGASACRHGSSSLIRDSERWRTGSTCPWSISTRKRP